jgi:hypothetical protein
VLASGQAHRLLGADVPVQGRATQGKRVITPGAGDRVVEVARVARESDSGRRSRAGEDAAEEDEEQLELMR